MTLTHDTIAPRCSCGRQLAPMPLQREATTVRYRTCRGCRQRWQVIARPRSTEHGVITSLTLTPINDRNVATAE